MGSLFYFYCQEIPYDFCREMPRRSYGFLALDVKKEIVHHDDVQGRNFVRQNQILCVIYAPMCVIGNAETVDGKCLMVPDKWGLILRFLPF